VRPPTSAGLSDEPPEHLHREIEVRDDPISGGSHSDRRPNSAAEQALGVNPNRADDGRLRFDCHQTRLAEHDPAPANVDQGVGGTQIDRYVGMGSHSVLEAPEMNLPWRPKNH
jgi:hypothetical protein